ncbi:hypothetical protein IQ241_14455 [Romeria aff. gracilis LEGE 07310]|uniref:Uncharacterized protein n=1 Tax=Vasconcelosia minhoensis LEGE 07310 TaxID=915328 RepID=A0A8J7AWH6_9CYAN|nr:hypothetical protein [Romeria gracilis]MBE9078483.1 hypothetical protein [Romeria aff. gracilis LEGE 07310]
MMAAAGLGSTAAAIIMGAKPIFFTIFQQLFGISDRNVQLNALTTIK